MYTDIRDYAIIGNLKSAVLVSKNGSVDWAPAPFIDSASVFGALLDDEVGGRWKICPRKEYASTQKYVSETNILETTFEFEGGVMKLTDFVPIEKDKEVLATEDASVFEIYRKARCIQGECPVEVQFMPKFDYARSETEVLAVPHGVSAGDGTRRAVLISEMDYNIDSGGRASAECTLAEGEEEIFIFRFNTTNVPENRDLNFELELQYTRAFWERWLKNCDLGRCNFTEHWQEPMERSALLLKILFFEPTGAVAAAPTTSLPEEIGGVRNWDYRYSWIRDAAFTLSALLDVGHLREAEKYLSWVLNICTRDRNLVEHPEHLQIMYGLHGEERLDEEYLAHLSGYKNSKPVRVGNRAYLQRQWDIYGSILDTVWKMCRVHKESAIPKDNWHIFRSLANHVMKVWHEPDEGLWEVRGGKKHFTYSKIMCWVALDRAVKLNRAYGLGEDVSAWEKDRDALRNEIFTRGWNKEKRAFAQTFDGDAMDSSLLRMPTVGFLSGKDPRMLSTIEGIERELSIGDGLLYRYKTEDGLPGEEGAFLLASFWYVDALVYAGEIPKAATVFGQVLERANSVGLYAEEIDIETGEFLGNFPQAYTHIGLINSAFNLSGVGGVQSLDVFRNKETHAAM